MSYDLLCRQELLIERERQKEEQVETLKRSMQSGMVNYTSFLFIFNHIVFLGLQRYLGCGLCKNSSLLDDGSYQFKGPKDSVGNLTSDKKIWPMQIHFPWVTYGVELPTGRT